jgi:hypothetical protein
MSVNGFLKRVCIYFTTGRRRLTASLFSSLAKTDHILGQYESAGETIVLCTLIFVFLYNNRLQWPPYFKLFFISSFMQFFYSLLS